MVELIAAQKLGQGAVLRQAARGGGSSSVAAHSLILILGRERRNSRRWFLAVNTLHTGVGRTEQRGPGLGLATTSLLVKGGGQSVWVGRCL